VIPLAVVAFTHLWNPIASTTIHPDEGYYIGRSIHVSEGLGPKEDAARYDHPYFGWLFLGSIFSVINYPDSAHPKLGDLNSIEMAWLFPRVTTGVLSVIDTFLIYKIAERRYNRNVALIAAILFAVMPYTRLARYVLLEPIQLPFLLTSILFALYTGIRVKQKESEENLAPRPTEENKMTDRGKEKKGQWLWQRQWKRQNQGQVDDQVYDSYSGLKSITSQNLILLLSSGIFLGLTIFTKVPAITLIPLVGFIIFTNNKRSFKGLGLWIIPVVLIPLIWPIHTVFTGEFEQWKEGINYQTTRPSKPLLGSLDFFYNEDRVLLILGSISFAFAAVTRKDFFFLIWVIPFLTFYYFVDYVSSFHLIPLIPAFCIGIAVMINDLFARIKINKKLVGRVLPIAIVSAIAIFGFTITASKMIENKNSADFDVIAHVTRYLPTSNDENNFAAYLATGSNELKANNDDSESSKNEPVTIVGKDPYRFWIFKYVFDKLGYDYKTPRSMVGNATIEKARDGSEKIIMIADEDFRNIVLGKELPQTSHAEMKAKQLSALYNSTKIAEKIHNVEIRTNY
jgi:Dolichyl-phosphate-mannose-protein mannosyltransferase